jgi:hypothetical protein
MRVTYELTADDYRHALIACRNRNFLTRWAVVLLGLFCALWAAIQVYLLIATPDQSWLRWSLPLTLWAVACLVYIQWGAPRLNARRQFRGTPSAKGPIELDVQDSGLQFRSEGTNGLVSWKHYLKWIEDEFVFVLFRSPLIFVLIPKRAFDAAQLLVFRQTLREKIVR